MVMPTDNRAVVEVLGERPEVIIRNDGEGVLLVSWEPLEGEAVAGEARRLAPGEKLARKNLDFIVANDVSRHDVGFESDHNEITIIAREGEATRVPRASKDAIAEAILDRVFGVVPATVGEDRG